MSSSIGKQNTCRTKPDKAALRFRSGTENRSYLYAIPGSHSNTEPDEFTLAQTCRTVSPFFLSTEIFFRQYLRLLISVPPQLHSHRLPDCWPPPWQAHWCSSSYWHELENSLLTRGMFEPSRYTCTSLLTATTVLPACCYSLAHLLFNTATTTVTKQAAGSAETPTAYPIPSRLQLGLLCPRNPLLDLIILYGGLSRLTGHAAFIWWCLRWQIHFSSWWSSSFCLSPHCFLIPSHFPLAAITSQW